MISQPSEFLACLVGWRAPWFVSLNVFAAFFELYDAAEQRVSEFLYHFYNIKGMRTKRCLRICCALAACVFPVWSPSGWHVVPRAYLCAFDATSVPNVARHVFFIIAQCVIISALKAMALLGICLLVTCRRPVHPATMTSLFWPVNRSSLQVKWQQLCFQRGKAVASCCLSVMDTFNCRCSLESVCLHAVYFYSKPIRQVETTAWICNSCFLPEGGV